LIISVVSGKGGAGKTTIAASLAHILQADCYDLDVDAPNGEHFLQPVDINKEIVYQQQPVIDAELCNACGTCVQECRFNALYMIHGTVYLTDNLCHSCGLCERVCPHEAVGYLESPLGKVRPAIPAPRWPPSNPPIWRWWWWSPRPSASTTCCRP
jgi:MinD superfamily P-loop ATPase